MSPGAIFFGWNTAKQGLLELTLSLVRGFKMMGCLAISICMGIISLFLVKCRQGLATVLKNAYCFVSVSFFYLVDLRICVCLRTKPWSDLSITFNQYVRNLSRKHWWGLIIFESIQLLTQSLIEYLSKIPSPHFQMQS